MAFPPKRRAWPRNHARVNRNYQAMISSQDTWELTTEDFYSVLHTQQSRHMPPTPFAEANYSPEQRQNLQVNFRHPSIEIEGTAGMASSIHQQNTQPRDDSWAMQDPVQEANNSFGPFDSYESQPDGDDSCARMNFPRPPLVHRQHFPQLSSSSNFGPRPTGSSFFNLHLPRSINARRPWGANSASTRNLVHQLPSCVPFRNQENTVPVWRLHSQIQVAEHFDDPVVHSSNEMERIQLPAQNAEYFDDPPRWFGPHPGSDEAGAANGNCDIDAPFWAVPSHPQAAEFFADPPLNRFRNRPQQMRALTYGEDATPSWRIQPPTQTEEFFDGPTDFRSQQSASEGSWTCNRPTNRNIAPLRNFPLRQPHTEFHDDVPPTQRVQQSEDDAQFGFNNVNIPPLLPFDPSPRWHDSHDHDFSQDASQPTSRTRRPNFPSRRGRGRPFRRGKRGRPNARLFRGIKKRQLGGRLNQKFRTFAGRKVNVTNLHADRRDLHTSHNTRDFDYPAPKSTERWNPAGSQMNLQCHDPNLEPSECLDSPQHHHPHPTPNFRNSGQCRERMRPLLSEPGDSDSERETRSIFFLDRVHPVHKFRNFDVENKEEDPVPPAEEDWDAEASANPVTVINLVKSLPKSMITNVVPRRCKKQQSDPDVLASTENRSRQLLVINVDDSQDAVESVTESEDSEIYCQEVMQRRTVVAPVNFLRANRLLEEKFVIELESSDDDSSLCASDMDTEQDDPNPSMPRFPTDEGELCVDQDSTSVYNHSSSDNESNLLRGDDSDQDDSECEEDEFDLDLDLVNIHPDPDCPDDFLDDGCPGPLPVPSGDHPANKPDVTRKRIYNVPMPPGLFAPPSPHNFAWAPAVRTVRRPPRLRPHTFRRSHLIKMHHESPSFQVLHQEMPDDCNNEKFYHVLPPE